MSINDQQIEWVLEILKEAQKSGFYGDISFNFKNGQVYLVREQRTIRPPDNQNTDYRSI